MAVDDAPLPWRQSPVGVVGLGLIGGSIALDLRQLGFEVRGLAHRAVTASRALERGLVDVASTDPALLRSCGLVVLALPLDQLLEPDAELVDALPGQAVITDVGSVKQPVLSCWQSLHSRFVASHPMAGTAESGVESGLSGLFLNRPWVATPTSSTDAEALATVADLAALLGARWLCCSADAHDQAVALISHLPVLVSAALLQAADRGACGALAPLVRALASSGFADTTRVGGGNPQLGTLMARHNREALLVALQAYQQGLAGLEQQVLAADWTGLQASLSQAQQLRPAFVQPTEISGA